ncbi:MAG: lactonase family protein [Actinophytocola sp.]|uniref:lactonase family protein n=1 Tax=Actinophytocola sp. TaxID=1872138 RepID=UPI003C781AD1
MLDRREFLGYAGFATAAFAMARTGGELAAPSTVYLGTFGGDLRTGEVGDDGTLTVTGTVAGVPDASFLAFHDRFLYTTNEGQGRVTALDRTTNTVLNTASSGGAGPTHLSVHPDGYLLTANYSSGSVAVHRRDDDGTIGERTDLVQHVGTDRDPHAHQVLPDPTGRWVLAVDLGADSVYVYGLTDGVLTQHQQLRLPTGAGPRHLAFHPSEPLVYVLGELRPEITVATWADGTLTPGQVIPTAQGGNFPAEIAVSSDGRFVYASNRGDNTIAAFAVTGDQLTALGATPTGGDWPRHFTLSQDEQRIYVSNQNSGTVTWLPRDPATGTLGPMEGSATVPSVGIVAWA